MVERALIQKDLSKNTRKRKGREMVKRSKSEERREVTENGWESLNSKGSLQEHKKKGGERKG